jgi:hypothetical protein
MTVYAYASVKTTDSTYSRGQATVSVDTTVEGDKVTWISDTAGADITLAKFDPSRASEYIDVKNPLIVVKCTSDSSSTNTLVKSEDGTTLHTFIADHSSAVGYAAFRLVAGSRNTASWWLA